MLKLGFCTDKKYERLLLSVCMLLLAQQNKASKINRFTFQDCGGPTAMISISQISVAPDPLYFPGPLYTTASFIINSDVDSRIAGNVLIENKVLGTLVEVPCIDNFGSCKYPDLCDLLQQVQCPDPIVRIGIYCHCPLKANSYMLPKTEFYVGASVIPAGDYHVIYGKRSGVP